MLSSLSGIKMIAAQVCYLSTSSSSIFVVHSLKIIESCLLVIYISLLFMLPRALYTEMSEMVKRTLDLFEHALRKSNDKDC